MKEHYLYVKSNLSTREERNMSDEKILSEEKIIY